MSSTGAQDQETKNLQCGHQDSLQAEVLQTVHSSATHINESKAFDIVTTQFSTHLQEIVQQQIL